MTFLLLFVLSSCCESGDKDAKPGTLTYVVFYPGSSDTIVKVCQRYWLESYQGTNVLSAKMKDSYMTLERTSAPIKVISFKVKER